ncbi:MAG TPA: hypothetical protein VF316_15130 [Polyangiaceae bacterium]
MSSRSDWVAVGIGGLVALVAVGLFARREHARHRHAPSSPVASASARAKPTQPAPRPTAIEDEDAGAPLSARCRALRDGSERVVAQLASSAPHPACVASLEGMSFLTCYDDHRVTWGMRIERANRDVEPGHEDEDYCGSLGFHVRLVHVDAAGHEASAMPGAAQTQLWKPDGGVELQVNVSQIPYWGSLDLDEPTYLDFDGDGDPEVIVSGSLNEEGYNPNFHEIWTFKDGAVVAYAPAKGLVFDDTVDLDDDGRPDLLTRGPFAKVEADSALGGTYPIAPLLFAAHSRAGGAFAQGDAAALAYAKKECGPAGPLQFATFDEDAAKAIVCARLHGVTTAAVVQTLDAQCKSYVDVVMDSAAGQCPVWTKALAAVDPPFQVR